MIRREGHGVYTAVSARPPDALALLQTAGLGDFQLSPAWFDNFARTVDLAGAQPEFHTWHQHGRLLALLPLLARPGGVSGLGNYYTTRWAPLLAEHLDDALAADSLEALLRGLLKHRGPHTLRLGPLQADSREEGLLAAALRRVGCAVWPLHAFQNWTLAVDTASPSPWPAYLAARDGRLRSTITRMGKRFAGQGGRLELLQGRHSLDAGIAAYEAVYAASWKQAEPHPSFMPGVIRAAADQGCLRLGLAWLGQEPVAAQVWMVSGGRADIYKLAHDEAHKDTSPGTLLTARLMQHVFEVDRVEVVDYLSGDDAYKRLWMAQSRERRSLLAYNLRHPRGLALAGLQALGVGTRHGLARLRGGGSPGSGSSGHGEVPA